MYVARSGWRGRIKLFNPFRNQKQVGEDNGERHFGSER